MNQRRGSFDTRMSHPAEEEKPGGDIRASEGRNVRRNKGGVNALDRESPWRRATQGPSKAVCQGVAGLVEL